MFPKSFDSARLICFLVFVLFVTPTLPLIAKGEQDYDWPQWRGPNRDGISAETDWDAEALVDGPRVLWHVDIGMGYSNVAVKDGRLYTMGRTREGVRVFCLNADTGREIWQHRIRLPQDPQSTPTIDGGYVYALDYGGNMVCLKAKNGKRVWSRNLTDDFESPKPKYGYGCSPCVTGSLVMLNTRTSGIALDKSTGEKIWEGKVHIDKVGRYFATPVVYSYLGREYALIFSFSGLYSLDVETGEQLWFYEWTKTGSPNVADPVLFDGKVFVSSSETDSRGGVLDISGAEPQLVWENHDMANHISTSIYLNGYLYGVDGDYHINIQRCSLRCLDAETGELMWHERTGGASLSAADGKLIVLTAKGRLHIVEATPSGFVEISSCDLPAETQPHHWWTPPVLCNAKIYCRNFKGDLICIDVSK